MPKPIKAVIYRHNGEDWIATVDKHLQKRIEGKLRADGAIVKYIVHDRDKLYRIHTSAMPGGSAFGNPFLATVEPEDVIYEN